MKPVVASTAYLLISHGSRDPRPQEAMNRLADLVRKHLEAQPQSSVASGKHAPSPRVSLDTRNVLNDEQPQQPLGKSGENAGKKNLPNSSLLTKPRLDIATPTSSKVIVGTACLELAPIPLSEQIYEFSQRLIAAGVAELKLLPVFLMPGVHVMEDIPAEIAAVRERLGDTLQLTLFPHLGSHPGIADILANRLAATPAEGSLLVAHGSRRPKGNRAIKGLAKRLNTAVAYWSVPPDIESQVIELMQQGCQRLTILPYFLFAGGITDAIAHRTEELAERFPKIKFRLLPTLGASDEIADLAVALIHQSNCQSNRQP